MLDRGYWKVGTVRGVPVRLHWSLPLGVLFFTGFRFAPVAWFAFVTLLLVHELGHAYLARRYRQRVDAIEITGFGGLCRWSGVTTPWERGVIAWGGVLAQAVLLIPTFALVAVLGPVRSPALAELTSVFLATNLWLMGLNLLPVPPLDGARAWSIVPALIAKWRARSSTATPARRQPPPAPPPSPELAELLRKLGDDARRARGGSRS